MDDEMFDEEKFIEYAEEQIDMPVDENQAKRFAAFAKLNEITQQAAAAFRKLGASMHIPFEKVRYEKKPTKHPGSNNHNKKRNKVRSRMAVASNRMNRSRHRKWKHT